MTSPRREGMVRAAGFYNCERIDLLRIGEDREHRRLIKRRINLEVRKAGYTLMPGSEIFPYSRPIVPEHGYSYRAHIGESGLDIHTWPEKRHLSFVAHTCSDEKKCNKAFWLVCEFLREYFGAKRTIDCGHLWVPTDAMQSFAQPLRARRLQRRHVGKRELNLVTT